MGYSKELFRRDDIFGSDCFGSYDFRFRYRRCAKCSDDALRLDSLPISGSRLLIKLDLQGSEFEALEGMGELWPRCGGMLLEVSIGPDGTYEKIRNLLVRHGFREHSTTNELEIAGRVVEADKLWLRSPSHNIPFAMINISKIEYLVRPTAIYPLLRTSLH